MESYSTFQIICTVNKFVLVNQGILVYDIFNQTVLKYIIKYESDLLYKILWKVNQMEGNSNLLFKSPVPLSVNVKIKRPIKHVIVKFLEKNIWPLIDYLIHN